MRGVSETHIWSVPLVGQSTHKDIARLTAGVRVMSEVCHLPCCGVSVRARACVCLSEWVVGYF